MVDLIKNSLPVLTLISDLVLVFIFAAVVFRNSWGKDITLWLGRNTIALGICVALAAVMGSLFYSNVVGFLPCDLCWWQRIFIYPQLILFLTALKYKDRGVFKYVWRLAVLAIVVSIYHVYVQMGGDPLLPCSATASCTKVFVNEFGYVTIPTMALTISLYFLLLTWANKLHENRNA